MSQRKISLIERLIYDPEYRSSYIKYYAWVLKRKPSRKLFMRMPYNVAMEMELEWEKQIRNLKNMRYQQQRSEKQKEQKGE